jgi:hypothetical protein
MTEEEKGDLADKGSAPVIAAYNAGMISQQTGGKELKELSERTGIFTNITDEEIEKMDSEIQIPGEMGLGGLGGEGEKGESEEQPKGPGESTSKFSRPNPRRELRQLSGGAMDSDHQGWPTWIGVDLDGTLAMKVEPFDPLMIGKPIMVVVDRVKRALARGKTVKVFTARLAHEGVAESVRGAIRDWTRRVIGQPLEATSQKDPGCEEIWDLNGKMGMNPLISSVADEEKIKKRLVWHGLDVSIENPAGSVREGVDRDGNAWSVRMTHDYGYLRKTRGVDGDHVDVFVGPDRGAERVYVVHTMKAPDFAEYDEDKCFIDFSTPFDARQSFFANYDRPEHFGSMDELSVGDFIDKVLATKDKAASITADERSFARRFWEAIRGSDDDGEFKESEHPVVS